MSLQPNLAPRHQDRAANGQELRQCHPAAVACAHHRAAPQRSFTKALLRLLENGARALLRERPLHHHGKRVTHFAPTEELACPAASSFALRARAISMCFPVVVLLDFRDQHSRGLHVRGAGRVTGRVVALVVKLPAAAQQLDDVNDPSFASD